MIDADLANGELGLTWAPTSSDRRRARGFDQAERLARLIGRAAGHRATRLLVRTSTQPQSGRDAADRWAGPSFRARTLAPTTVIVVDDVVTTGATLSAAATALRQAGARTVIGLAVTRAPLIARPNGHNGPRSGHAA